MTRRLGYPVLLADCGDTPQTPEGLLTSLGPHDHGDAVAFLKAPHPVVLLDACEELGTRRARSAAK
jgi:hypothetical protein